WAKISDSESKQFGQELASFGGGVITYGAAGGVDKFWNKKNSGVVAILARMNVTKKFQKSLKGNEAKFISKFEGGIKKTKGIKVLSSGTGSFAGQSKASEMQVLNKSTGAR